MHEPYNRRTALKLLLGCAALARMSGVIAADPTQSLVSRAIPRSGERIPVVGLGTWQTFDVGPATSERSALKEVLRLFTSHGASLIDSSPMYGNAERVSGDLISELGVRDQMFIATKVWTSGRDAGIKQMEQSMRRLGTQRIDLMQVHNLLDVDAHTGTLRAWQQSGRLRYIGVTHYHAGAFAELERLVRTRQYDFAQFNYSLQEREAEARLLPACAETGTAVLINRPFAEGALFRQVRGRSVPPWAGEFDCSSWAQFFLKYIVSHPAVTCVIPATSNPQHLLDNLQAGSGRPPDAAMRRRMVEHFERGQA
jgi:aryl-alcohol dehydrogenase-like predicted oxidoreductase